MLQEKKWDFKINNNTSQKAEIIFSAAETQGTIIPYAANSYNIGETVDLSFEPKPGVRFLGWKILDSEGKDPEDSIVITGDKKEPKAKLSVLNSIKGVSISPVTEIIPMVSGNVLPAFADSGVPAYSKISVNFITPMNPDDLNETFKYISITCDGHSITDKFQLPELSSDGKLLTIKPVAGEMEKLVTNAVAEITVILHKEMRSTQTTESCLEEDFTWTYRINKETADLVPPKIESISLKMNNVNGKTLTAENCTLWVDNDYKQNHINDTLWVSCIGSDADSGVKTVKITETLLYAPDGTIVNKDIPNNLNGYGVFLERTPGNFTTEFAYKLCSPENGIIQLDFVIYDNANLPSTTKKTFFVIKDTNIPVSYNIHNSDPASPETITTNVTVDKVNDVWASNIKMTSKKYSTVFENSLSYGTSPAMLKPAAKTTDSSGNSVFSVKMNKTEDTILVYNTADEVGNSVSIERYIPKSPYIVKVEWDSSYKLTAGVDSDKSSSNSGIAMCYRKQGDTSWKSDNNMRDITEGTQFEVAAYAYVKNGGTLYGTCSDLYDSSKTEDTDIALPAFTIDAVEPGPLNSGLTYLTVKLTSERNPEAKYFAMYNGVYYYLNFDSNNLAKFPYTVTSSTIRNGLTVIGVKGTKNVSSAVNYYKLPSSSDNDTTHPRLYYPPDNEERSAKESLIKNAFSYDGNYLITYSFYDNGSASDGGGIKTNFLDGKDSMPTLMKYLIIQNPDWTCSQGLQYSNLQKNLLSTLNNTSHSELSTYGFMSYNQKYTKYVFPNNYTYIPFSNSGYYVTAVPIKDIEDNTNLICDFICYDNNGNNSESTSIAWYGTVKTLAKKPTLSISGSNIIITIKMRTLITIVILGTVLLLKRLIQLILQKLITNGLHVEPTIQMEILITKLRFPQQKTTHILP